MLELLLLLSTISSVRSTASPTDFGLRFFLIIRFLRQRRTIATRIDHKIATFASPVWAFLPSPIGRNRGNINIPNSRSAEAGWLCHLIWASSTHSAPRRRA